MDINSFLDKKFCVDTSDWEITLQKELKTDLLGLKKTKKLSSGSSWPILSLQAQVETRFNSKTPWKKASQTYAYLSTELMEQVQDDLNNGVRNFFLYTDNINQESWDEFNFHLSHFDQYQDVDVFLLGEKRFTSDKVRVIHSLISGKNSVFMGGHDIHELAQMAVALINSSFKDDHLYIGVYLGLSFFQNIAKLRSARLLSLKIIQELNLKNEIKIVGLTDFRGWTLFEGHSNILRNEVSVASGLLGGADHIQSAGHNIIFKLETDLIFDEAEDNKSFRIARNTSHILSLESMLGVVDDPSYGSYHLENLTQYFCQEAWALMQKMLQGYDISNDIKIHQSLSLDEICRRKVIVSGINDFPDPAESFEIDLKQPLFFRRSRVFEELRLKLNNLSKPIVKVAVVGNATDLYPRFNFVKNYFELLGLKVESETFNMSELESLRSFVNKMTGQILILCSKDEDYPNMNLSIEAKERQLFYTAGKFEMAGFKNIYQGQNVLEVLSNLVTVLEGTR